MTWTVMYTGYPSRLAARVFAVLTQNVLSSFPVIYKVGIVGIFAEFLTK